ncbi:MarR family winged helix-turn-helix transcriptional regulator [Nocardia sp. NPDC020380]|uniref:MarR family winged helix-turn-helix transcriptional regulator n=1 Tax=Nocardia sp. NPDC020380 TaxID=3364309 RepID=UPI00379F7BDD
MGEKQADAVDAIEAQWRRERPDLNLEAMAIIGRLGRLYLIAGQQIESVHGVHGLQRGEFDVLAALRRSGEPYELNPSVLADTLMASRAGMTGRLDRLEKAGLVRRVADAGDRRAVKVVLTDRGLQVIDVAVTEHVENETRILAPLSAGERQELDRMVRVLLAGLGTLD